MKTPALIVVLTAAAVILWMIFGNKKPTRFIWEPQYEADSKEPFGLFVLKNLLSESLPADSIVFLESEGVNDLPGTGGNTYLFIGQQFYYDSNRLEQLLRFAEAGNDVVLVVETFAYQMLDHLQNGQCGWIEDYQTYLHSDEELDEVESQPEDTSAVVVPAPESIDAAQDLLPLWDRYYVEESQVNHNLQDLVHLNPKGYEMKYLVRNEPVTTSWEYIQRELLCEESSGLQILGTYQDTLVNFIRINRGAGAVFLHTSPLAFTNVNVMAADNATYVSGVFSKLRGGTLYWDDEDHYITDAISDGQAPFQPGPLQYILSQAPLAMAWYLLLSMALLFLIFGAKRRQRIIPVLESNTNTTLEFVENIGQLYFQSEDYRSLLLLKISMFSAFVRQRYRLPTNTPDTQFVQQLAAMSGISEEDIAKMMTISRNVENTTFVSQNTLLELHRLQDSFYQHCQ